jgi:hypothetical protein
MKKVVLSIILSAVFAASVSAAPSPMLKVAVSTASGKTSLGSMPLGVILTKPGSSTPIDSVPITSAPTMLAASLLQGFPGGTNVINIGSSKHYNCTVTVSYNMNAKKQWVVSAKHPVHCKATLTQQKLLTIVASQ